MSCLAPCPTCNRHVSTDETTCPFCSAALPDSIRCQPRQRLRGRLSRAGLLAAGAVLMSGAEACGLPATHYGGNMPRDAGNMPYDAGEDTPADTGPADGGAVALYGAAPALLEQAPPEEAPKPPAKSDT
jgi:hypothetical protein